ncbi:MAG: ATPase, T2SS/T4P/T4SS family [Candidatus Omnitrophica bacterium]|nr:ATPase, T2SS/T4P/T4SS family [Candidatus Omnitrophota bacterium]
MIPKEKYLRLGELLLKEGIITQVQLEQAIRVQKQEGGRLGEILIRLGILKEEQAVAALGKQLNIPYFSPGTELKPALDQNLDTLIAKDYAIKNSVLPLSLTLNSLTVAICDPLDIILIDNLRKLTAHEINPVISAKSDINKAIERFYGRSTMFEEAVEASYDVSSDQAELDGIDITDQELSIDKLIARAEEAPVVKLVDLIIRQAIDERASDIHVEPFKDRISLRYRIDGKLYEIPPPAKHLHLAILSRIKILSKLDIAEKRLPQDGGFIVRVENRPIDLRVSTVPTIYGEKVVLRVLDRGAVVLDLGRLGFDSKQLEYIRHAGNAPYGLVFLTGPTGCGKTTTLYAILNEIRSPTKNIITIEDPVEYKLDGINQVQVKPEIGLTFANALRCFLRQDPDIMLVGEVRDLETAQICIRSALTGHLVFSTIHTNDAASAVTRIIDIGIEPFMVAPSLQLVVAQRLVRKLCPDCKEAYEPSPEQMKNFNIKIDLLYKPKGCVKCKQLGYRGRTCLAEVMIINEEIRSLISKNASFQTIRDASVKAGMQTLYDTGIKKAEEGVTSLEEALSVTMGVQE